MARLQPCGRLHHDRGGAPAADDSRLGAQPANAAAVERPVEASISAEPPDPVVVTIVAESSAGDRLDRFVGALPRVGSRAVAERLVAAGAVTVDGAQRSKSYRLREGEHVEVVLLDLAPAGLVAEKMELDVRYEDEHLLVVDKPAGLVVHPGAGHDSGTLVHGLLGRGADGGPEGRPGIVHRLDRDTSGLLVVARSPEAHRRLAQLVAERSMRREYTALVRGRPLSWRGRIDAPIGRDRHDASKQSLDTRTPRNATTHFAVVDLLAPRALLRVELETGRTHQIRVHLAAIDLPVSGDPTYGAVGDLGLARQFLHAARLTFQHPFSGVEIAVTSGLPPDLTEALERARQASDPAAALA